LKREPFLPSAREAGGFSYAALVLAVTVSFAAGAAGAAGASLKVCSQCGPGCSQCLGWPPMLRSASRISALVGGLGFLGGGHAAASSVSCATRVFLPLASTIICGHP